MAITVTVPSEVFGRILSPLGYPIISVADLTDNSMTEQQLKDILIWGALKKYFSFFPKEIELDYTVSTSFSIPFPSETTFGIVDARLSLSTNAGVIRSGNAFLDQMFIHQGASGMTYKGRYGSRYDYDMTTVRIMEKAVSQSMVENNRTFQVKVNHSAKTLTGYANISGRLNVIWAEYSTNWSDVLFSDEEDVVSLARAEVLEYFGRLRNQEVGSLPTDLNGDDLISRAKDLKDEIIEKWENRTKIVIIR